VKIVVAGQGAFGVKHIEAIQKISGITIASLAGGSPESTAEVARKYGIPHWTTNLEEALAQPGVESPTSDNLADAEKVLALQQETGLIAMAGHTRRFNPSHQWIHKRIQSGELKVQQMDVQTYFFRRTNMNALGKPRSWTDHLLWHHACHTVDLFQYQTGQTVSRCHALQGPPHPDLGIAMDMSIGLKVPSGAICTLSLSFNNDGPLGTFFRYICDNGTYIARYDDLLDGNQKPIDVSKVDVSMNGIELQDREFFSAIREGREPNASVRQVVPCMRTLDRLEQDLLKG